MTAPDDQTVFALLAREVGALEGDERSAAQLVLRVIAAALRRSPDEVADNLTAIADGLDG